jgi:hypothetical protein
MFHDLDVVAFTKPVDDPRDGHFPAGTSGTIVALEGPYALVEIVRENGTTAGLVGVRLADLELLVPARAAS